MIKTKLWFIAGVMFASQIGITQASVVAQTKGDYVDKFRQLDEVLPTPNVYRSAAGEPGEQYWQQQANYTINVRLDEEKRRIDAQETIQYFNNSPYTLKYIWIQLDQNIFRNDSMAERSATFNSKPDISLGGVDKPAKISLNQLRRQQFMADNELGFSINKVADSRGRALDFVIVGTNMRVDLPTPLKLNQNTALAIDFGFNIVEEDAVG